MGITARFQRWNLTHPSFLLLFIRIVLGMILLAKGIFFISHAQHLKELILESRFAPGVGFLAAYTTFAHLFGGVFIIIGLLTRLAVILQIPVLLGALFFHSSRAGAPRRWFGSDSFPGSFYFSADHPVQGKWNYFNG